MVFDIDVASNGNLRVALVASSESINSLSGEMGKCGTRLMDGEVIHFQCQKNEISLTLHRHRLNYVIARWKMFSHEEI